MKMKNGCSGPTVYYGTFIHSNDERSGIEILERSAVGVDHGRIVFIEKEVRQADIRQILLDHDYSPLLTNMVVIPPTKFAIPGFVDTHIHASQYPNAGLALDKPLLEWLNEYTFPTEARFVDLQFSEMVYKKVVQKALSYGTTMASYFATNDVNSTLLLCDIVESMGQRAYVGKVSSDTNSPSYYVETTPQAIGAARDFVKQALARKYSHVTPCITPRFAVSCTKELMMALGALAAEFKLPIQTHLSESIREIETVQEMHGVSSYFELYKDCGLATPDTVFAHCVYSTSTELLSMAEVGCGVAHCPTSNTNLMSGLFQTRRALGSNVRVGLGTDVSGGHLPSILQVIQRAIDVSKFVSMGNWESSARTGSSDGKSLSAEEAFCLATLGGARALNQDANIGTFHVGKCFDALIVNPIVEGSPIDLFEGEKLPEWFNKFIMLGDDRNVECVYVDGRCVVDKRQ